MTRTIIHLENFETKQSVTFYCNGCNSEEWILNFLKTKPTFSQLKEKLSETMVEEAESYTLTFTYLSIWIDFLFLIEFDENAYLSVNFLKRIDESEFPSIQEYIEE